MLCKTNHLSNTWVLKQLFLVGGARGGLRPVRPKQALTVAGGRVVASPLGPGMKSGIRPIEAMLGSGTQTSTSTTTLTLGQKVCSLEM